MIIKYHKKFLKDLSIIPSSDRTIIEQFVFEDIQKFDTLYAVKKFEQMRGYTSYYKVRFGSYRVGVKFENDVLTFERILHRKEIYRSFP